MARDACAHKNGGAQIMAGNPIVDSLLSGIINAHWVTLDLLDQKGILPREESISFFKQALAQLEEGQNPNDPAQAALGMPMRHLIRALSAAPPHPEKPKPRWVPVVIRGGPPED